MREASMIEWILRKWTRQPDPPDQIRQAYQVAFGSVHGQIVLQHLVDNVYATVCYSKDDIELATHNGRRSVIQDILENVYTQADLTQPKE